MINLRRMMIALVLGICLGVTTLAQSAEPYMTRVSVEFQSERIDGYVASQGRAVYESNIDAASLIESLSQGNQELNPNHPRMMEVRVLDSWPGGYRVYQKYGVRFLAFRDTTEMILEFDVQWQNSTGISSWHMVQSPDDKMIDSRGTWTIRPKEGSNINQGPSILEYEVTTIFNRTDYIFARLVNSFGEGELKDTLKYITRSLLP